MSKSHSATAVVMETEETRLGTHTAEEAELIDVIQQGPSAVRVKENAVSAVKSLEERGSIPKVVARQWIQNIKRDIARNGV